MLLAWNVWLTAKVAEQPAAAPASEPAATQTTVVNNTVNGYTTDITNTVAASAARMVSVSAGREDLMNAGSGIVYSVNGGTVYIYTNAHIVADADSIQVTFDNGTMLPAVLVGSDPATDLALLSVTPEFTVAPFSTGDSSLLKKGEYVITAGASKGLDFEGASGFGIASSIDRSIAVDVDQDGVSDWNVDAIETDAPVNAANTGGALLNLSGELIGILSSKITSSGSGAMGFAVSADEAGLIAQQLIAKGSVSRGYLGVSGRTVSQMTVYQKSGQNLQLDEQSGVFVSYTEKGSPAEEAGILPGDVIVSINDVDVASVKALNRTLYEHAAGDKVEVGVLRGGVSSIIEVTLR